MSSGTVEALIVLGLSPLLLIALMLFQEKRDFGTLRGWIPRRKRIIGVVTGRLDPANYRTRFKFRIWDSFWNYWIAGELAADTDVELRQQIESLYGKEVMVTGIIRNNYWGKPAKVITMAINERERSVDDLLIPLN